MAIFQSLVGQTAGPWRRSWTATDTALYALAVGAGQEELAWSTGQEALPTFGIVLAQFGAFDERLGDYDPALLLHGEQEIVVRQPLPPSGSVSVLRTVTDVFDKGTGALVASRWDATDDSGKPLLSTSSSVFVRGEGGFGGERGPSLDWEPPARPPDVSLRFTTSANQALLYRLTGDHNPLHVDPEFAARGGFDRPILHGLCTYGITCRLLIREFCGAARVRRMFGRFSLPVVPGAELVVSAWRTGPGEVAFRTADSAGAVVLDRGAFTYS
ncbi:enoyl-CoA hydratase [Allokutzneria sp. A3M-2-11 16]|uniref:MaoC/PaaZ C-terminal domain-containing protein n=1 Tax=Allokutzneria sp. A3M-2-11 16 TaxID=2962043 RepID=UPI0020B84972|nr:MaoC/PaaZ C-terminal domain-containing protein [Allokutzneria sp. A3M-2-11 16]MCP3801534.1 enoyl-CoA hydratase [Allokutzneria sp. A3M-2-11 16]